jgi:GNAT superfamily N-acetyltransferase
MKPTEVTTWHLEQRAPDDLRPAPEPAAAVSVVRVERPSPEFARYLYAAVGLDWWWYSRLAWTRDAWAAWLARPDVEMWVVYEHGAPAGYFELERQPAGNVEIVYFGLLPHAIGRGIGGWMLTEALRRAWAIDGTKRVWLHTCTLDGPHARANYEARGLRLFDTVVAMEDLPDEMPALFPD